MSAVLNSLSNTCSLFLLKLALFIVSHLLMLVYLLLVCGNDGANGNDSTSRFMFNRGPHYT